MSESRSRSSSTSSYSSEESKGDNVMALFASYYGIEQSGEEESEPGGGPTLAYSQQIKNLDDQCFQPEVYVKELLLTETIEGLVTKDAEMVHEIRTLDGEMQKLVYDNYNKFITATDTIKEMKHDIHNLDSEIKNLRSKLTNLVEKSTNLDDLISEKRNHVDKLVRIRRLLQRLEFLAGLPDHLLQLIDGGLYEEAVKLYEQTNEVLLRHIHVLSLRNIKERTELIMSDLSDKLLTLLDDPLLEANRLTHLVKILCTINNRDRLLISKKFIQAHTDRSHRMIKNFDMLLTQIKEKNNIGKKDKTTAAFTSQKILENLQDISNARQFHQSILVGLIEFCKGMLEIFNETKGMKIKEFNSFEVLEEFNKILHGILHEYMKSFSLSFGLFFSRFESFNSIISQHNSSKIEILLNQLKNIYQFSNNDNKFFNLFSDLLSSHYKSHHFFSQFYKEISSDLLEELNTSTELDNYQKNLDEERKAWLLLASQSLLDIEYLDNVFKEVVVKINSLSFSSSSKKFEITSTFSLTYGESFIKSLELHINALVKNFIFNFFLQISFQNLPLIYLLSHFTLKTETKKSSFEIFLSQSLHDPHSKLSLNITNQIFDKIYSIISEDILTIFLRLCKYYKPVLGIYEIFSSHTKQNHKNKRHTFSISSPLTSNLLFTFIKEFLIQAEHFTGLFFTTNGKALLFSPQHHFSYNAQKRIEMESEISLYSIPPYDCYDEKFTLSHLFNEKFNVIVSNSVQVISMAIFKKIELNFFESINREKLNVNECDEETYEVLETITDSHLMICQKHLELVSFVLYDQFIEENSKLITLKSSRILDTLLYPKKNVENFYSLPTNTSFKVSTPLLELLVYYDQLFYFVSLLFSDNLFIQAIQQKFLIHSENSQALSSSSSLSNTTSLNTSSLTGPASTTAPIAGKRMKRQSMMMHASSSTAAAALQMDIEKLFQEKVKIFQVQLPSNSSEAVLNMIFKATIKASQESIRLVVINKDNIYSIFNDFYTLKYFIVQFLKDSHECEALFDSFFNTVYSRLYLTKEETSAGILSEVGDTSSAAQKNSMEFFTFLKTHLLLSKKTAN